MAKEEEKEKKDLLGREDIRTMQKDILRLQEEGAKEKRGKIASIEVPEKKKKEERREEREEEKREDKKEETKKAEETPPEKISHEKWVFPIRFGPKTKVPTPKKEMPKRAEVRHREEEEEKSLVEEIEKKWLAEKERAEKERGEKEKALKEKAQLRAKEAQSLEEGKTKIDTSLQEIEDKRKPLQEKIKDVLSRVDQFKFGLQPILEKEREIEDKKRKIDTEENKNVSAERRREIEKERWQVEKEREEIEAKKWGAEEQIESLGAEIKEAENGLTAISQEEEKLRYQRKEISKREQEIVLEEEKSKIEEEMVAIQKEKEPLEMVLGELSEKNKKIEETISTILKDEKSIEQEIKIIEEREVQAPSVGERKEIEKERWQVEKDRKEVEQERWNLEEEKNKIALRIKEASLKLQRVKNKEERLQERIKEIDRNRSKIEELRKEREKPIEKPKREEPEEIFPETSSEEIPEQGFGDLNEEELIKKAQERLEKIRQDREGGIRRTWQAPKITPESLEEKQEERRPEPKVFFDESSENFQPVSPPRKPSKGKIKVEEMRAQEEEARKKFLERVEGKEGATLFEEEYGEKIEPPSVILKTLPRKSSSYDKLFVRILVLLLFFVIAAGGLYLGYLFIKKKASSPEGTPKTEAPAEEKPPVVPEEPAVSPSPFEIVETEPLQIFENNNEIPTLLEKFFKLSLTSSKFTRVSFLNIKTNRYVGLKEFLDALQIKTPEGFYQKLAGNEVFFVRSQQQGKRFGFLVKIKENESESMENMLRLWEPEMEANFEVLYKMMGKNQPALVPYFTELSHQGVSYRCQTFTKLDLGICHLITDGYVVLASSSESMGKIIEELAVKQ